MIEIKPTDNPFAGRGAHPLPQGDFRESSLSWMIDHRKLIFDTGSFFASGAVHAITGSLLPELKNSGERLLVLDKSVRLIQDGLNNSKGQDRIKYVQAEEILCALEAEDAWVRLSDPLEVDGTTPLNTSTLISDLVMIHQLIERFCVVTQTEALAKLLLDNSFSPAIRGVKEVTVAYIEDGKFLNWIPRLNRRLGLEDAEPDFTQRIAKHFRVVVDTCSLMLLHPVTKAAVGLSFFKEKLVPELIKNGAKMVLPQRVLNELQNHAGRLGPAQAVAQEALHFFRSSEIANVVVVASDELELSHSDPNFADPVLVRVRRFQSLHNICMITQDANLAALLLNNHDSWSGKDYQVVFITIGGKSLCPWEKKFADINRNVP